MTRVQRRRTRGWRMPAGAVYVGRPTRWGNPFSVAEYGRVEAVEAFGRWLTDQPDLVAAVRRELAGHTLVCWCPLNQPCHADILAAIVNEDTAR